MFYDYVELLIEASERCDLGDLSEHGERLIPLAERMLSKRLRISEQEKRKTISTDAEGLADLPSDFEEMRALFVSETALARRSFDSLERAHAEGYAIFGNRIRSSFKSTAHECFYFASLPSLLGTDANRNFPMRREPELYLQAVLFQAHSAAGAAEKAALHLAYLERLIEEANRAAAGNRLRDATKINFAGIAP